MEVRPLGTSGLRVSRLGLGTMTWGRQTTADDAKAQLDMYRNAGGTLIDSAASYADGGAETILGEALAARGDRDEVVLSTKAGIGRRGGGRHVDASRRSLLNGLDDSLARLRTDHVDLWEVHAWDPYVPFEETCAALDHAVSSGRARYVGISNYSGWQTGTVAAWQRAWPGRAPIVANQVEYSLLRRGIEDDVLPACATHGIGVLAWSPLAGGVLTGKYRGGIPKGTRGSDESWRDRVLAYTDEHGSRVLDAVATAAEGLESTPTAVALSWIRDRPGVAAALIGARTVDQLAGLLLADAFHLPDQIRVALDDVSA